MTTFYLIILEGIPGWLLIMSLSNFWSFIAGIAPASHSGSKKQVRISQICESVHAKICDILTCVLFPLWPGGTMSAMKD